MPADVLTFVFSVHLLKFIVYASIALVGLDLLIVEASRSQSDTQHSVGLLWTNDRPVAETST